MEANERKDAHIFTDSPAPILKASMSVEAGMEEKGNSPENMLALRSKYATSSIFGIMAVERLPLM